MASALSLLIGWPQPIPAPPPLGEALLSAQVTTAVGRRSGFQLTFAAGRTSPITNVLVPSGAFDPPMRVILFVLVGTQAEVLIDGVVTRQDSAPSAEPGGSTLTLTGEDLTVLMDLHDTVETYPAMAPNLAVQRILAAYAQYGITPVAISPPVSSTPAPQQRTPFQNGTDLGYINYLANNAGHVFYLTPGPVPGSSVAYWGPEVRAGVMQPALSLDLADGQNVESLTFGFDALAPETPTVAVTIPMTRITVEVPVPPVSLLKPPLALRAPRPLRTARARDVANKTLDEAAGQALALAARGTDAVTGSGQLDVQRYGHVLKARQLVGVRGAGIAYDGAYYVTSVTHSLKPGEYKQSFELARDGLVPLAPVVAP